MTTEDFIVSNRFGVSTSRASGPVRSTVVSGRPLIIASVSTISVRKDSSSSCLPRFFNIADRTLLVVRMSLSQTPPMWLVWGTFIFQLIQSHPSFKSSL